MNGIRVGAVVALVFLLASACGDDDSIEAAGTDDTLRIASFDFAESEMLAELYAQVAEYVGVEVTRLGPAGPREVVRPALETGAVDLIPEYLGTGLQFAGGVAVPSDPQEAVEVLRDLVVGQGLAVLDPAPAQDVNVFVVHADTARDHELVMVSDLADAGLARFGGPVECPDRPLCLLGLATTYDVEFDEFVRQKSLLFTAESLRSGEIDVGLLFSTSPELDDDQLVVLRDDRNMQPPENLVPMIRNDALERWPELEAALNEVASSLTTPELRDLNRQVANGTPASVAAAGWLEARGVTGGAA